MSEEDGIFIERSFQRTLNVCHLIPFPAMIAHFLAALVSFYVVVAEDIVDISPYCTHVENESGTRETHFVFRNSDCCLEADWATLSG